MSSTKSLSHPPSPSWAHWAQIEGRSSNQPHGLNCYQIQTRAPGGQAQNAVIPSQKPARQAPIQKRKCYQNLPAAPAIEDQNAVILAPSQSTLRLLIMVCIR
ncbi:hypothetical protein D3C76_1570430 [compost metagenome]